MVNVPEHRFTEDQIAELIELLGGHPANLPTMQGEGLHDAARWFTSSLVQQNYPPSSQIDKLLERIESAASRLRFGLSNPLATPYMRMAAGDVVEDDRTLDTAFLAVENLRRWSQEAREIIRRYDEIERIDEAERKALGEAIADANARGERKATRDAIAEARARAKVDNTAKRRTKGTPKGRAKKSAMRVLVHRLALLWLRTHHGIPPTVSVNRDGHASGKFIRFAQGYINAMREQTTDEHRQHARNIDAELAEVSTDTIAWHLRMFTARLPRPP